MNTPPADEPLTFRWHGHGQVSLALPGFLVLSLVVHAAAFFLFRIVYPEGARLLPPPARITLVSDATAEGRAFLRILDAENPVALTWTRDLTPGALLETPYRPSFLDAQPQPVTIPEQTPALAYPPVCNPLALLHSAAPQNDPPPQVTVEPPPTTVRFSGGIETRTPLDLPRFPVRTTSATALAPARFLLGINARGEVRCAFLQESSGNAAIDSQAEAFLMALRFQPGGAPFSWGFATLHWGPDVCPGPSATPNATPQSAP